MAKIRLLGSDNSALVLGREADTNVQTVGRSLANHLDQGGIEVGTLLQIEENELVTDAETTILFAMLPMTTTRPSGGLALDAAVECHAALLAFEQTGKANFRGCLSAMITTRSSSRQVIGNRIKLLGILWAFLEKRCSGACWGALGN